MKLYLSQSKSRFQEVINALNTLQSNAASIRKAEASTRRNEMKYTSKTENTKRYLERCHIDYEKLESKVIHVAGTKGKGTTCAVCESILRAHGYSTGFFSSPHLVAVRERIRINGKPLSTSAFSSYFWPIFNKLGNSKEHENDMPGYFNFLVIMAFNVFLIEKVDVVVVEVGIGGEKDCTNCFKKTPVVGITSLGLDHTKILGETIESIAWQKGGIMKPQCKAFTVPGQPDSAMAVLQQRAAEISCKLRIAPGLECYNWSRMEFNPWSLKFPLSINSALAVSLAHSWIEKQGGIVDITKTLEGLKEAKWAGRYQIFPSGKTTYYLDGAHTRDSILLCAEWFRTRSRRSGVQSVLLFNVIGMREVKLLLEPLLNLGFSYVYFSPNTVSTSCIPPDQVTVENDNGNNNCLMHEEIWKNLGGSGIVKIFPCIESALGEIPQEADVLVTGSIRLQGSVLTILDPNLDLTSRLLSTI